MPTSDQAGQPPSDAVVLFDGKDLSQWVSMDGSPTKWVVRDGYMECVKGSGYIRTLQNFGDCVFLGGGLAPIHADLPAARRDPLAGRLSGIGFVNEGLDYNPIVFDFLFEQAWRAEPVELRATAGVGGNKQLVVHAFAGDVWMPDPVFEPLRSARHREREARCPICSCRSG